MASSQPTDRKAPKTFLMPLPEILTFRAFVYGCYRNQVLVPKIQTFTHRCKAALEVLRLAKAQTKKILGESTNAATIEKSEARYSVLSFDTVLLLAYSNVLTKEDMRVPVRGEPKNEAEAVHLLEQYGLDLEQWGFTEPMLT